MSQRVSLSPSHLTSLFSTVPHSLLLPNEPFKNYWVTQQYIISSFKNNYNIHLPKGEDIWTLLLTKGNSESKIPKSRGWKPMEHLKILTVSAPPVPLYLAIKLIEVHINLITSLDGRETKRDQAFFWLTFSDSRQHFRMNM